MNDFQIRSALLKDIRKKYRSSEKTKNLVVQEMVLCRGIVRIDIALVNGALHGYEIKSSEDTLNRLHNQIQHYSKCFDYLTVVASEKHIKPILSNYPDWLGVSVACQTQNRLSIKKVRPARKNNNLSMFSLMQLLWKSELLKLASLYQLDRKLAYLSKNKIINNLASITNKAEVQKEIRNFLKERTTWTIAEVL